MPAHRLELGDGVAGLGPDFVLERDSTDDRVAADQVQNCGAPLLPLLDPVRQLLRFGHGVTGAGGRGAVPSAGGLQALDLYLVNLAGGWLPSGLYHYDRAGHHLSQLRAGADRDRWREVIPSLSLLAGGGLLWVITGDAAVVEAKYAQRGLRFLLLEAGHLMQNLCLLSASLGLVTVPLGGFFERECAAELALPATGLVLYTGLCGEAQGGGAER